jgi:hypothetical protein
MDTATRRRVLVAATVAVTGVVVVGLVLLATRRPEESVAAGGAPPGSTGVTPEPPAPTLPPPESTETTVTTATATAGPTAVPGCREVALPRPAGEPDDAARRAVQAAVAGCAEAEVQTRAQAAGWTIRVMSRDGEDLMGTMDYRPDRLNLTVEQGTVTSVDIG